jgi:hypothetical protein
MLYILTLAQTVQRTGACNLFYDVSDSGIMTSNGLVVDELERIWN